ncbi:site-specific DNA-methyltransferase [Pararobbsia silviterrae]|uniref:Methyltransferase n=2 Tax=Pararobbsia silviterrae TaxID=1792498 RepID=A0A494X346_9BURK|nr:site-specific DNA-methyltransferase [Pararobbsia silviterrae]
MPDASFDSIVTDPPYHLTNNGGGPARGSDNAYTRARAGASSRGFMGLEWDGGDIAFRPDVWRECLRVLKPGGHLLAFSAARTYHRMACAIEDAGFEVRDQVMWIYSSGFPKSKNLDGEWEGWGTALKPAHEPLCLARRPLEGTVAENVARYGVGALNIDGCRVASDELVARIEHADTGAQRGYGGGIRGGTRRSAGTDGRWPANVMHDGSDAVLAAFPSAPGQQGRAVNDGAAASNSVYGAMRNVTAAPAPRVEVDTSAARFFYCAKASRADRNAGLPSGDVPAVSQDSTMRACETADWAARNGNHHPTVKPTSLMQELCRLVTPPGGHVLDPFMGSGSTGRGAVLEGFEFSGIELSAAYHAIARARIDDAARARAELVRAAADESRARSQLDLFEVPDVV